MKDIGSYKIQSFASNVDKEILRLKAQVELFWEKEFRCYRSFGLMDGMRALECGSGPGYVLEKLIEHLPNSRITGIEIDGFLVKQSQERLAPIGGERLQILEQSIMDMDFPDDAFDFVISRLVLEHLPNPVAAAKEVCRVLKTGGKAIFIDNDFDMHLKAFPDIPELDDLYDAYCRCRAAEGGNPRIGRELPCILQEAGFANVDLTVVAAHSRIIGDEAFLKSEGSGIPAQLVKDGYLSRDILDRLTRKWSKTLSQPNHVFYRQLFVGKGEKLPNASMPLKSQECPVEEGKNPAAARDILCANPGSERIHRLTSYLVRQIALALKMREDRIAQDRSTIEMGVDSIAAVNIANLIAEDFAIEFSVVDILEAENIPAIAESLDQKINPGTQPSHLKDPMPSAGKEVDSGAIQDNAKEWEDGEI